MSKYGPEGFQADLPELITGRWKHACAGYYDEQDHFVLLVVGGVTNDGGIDYLSSTEIYKVGVSSHWTEVSALPYKLLSSRASTLNNLVYLTGEQ